MVSAPPLAHTLGDLLIISRLYKFATGYWLFKSEAKGDISRDVVDLAQMTQRTSSRPR